MSSATSLPPCSEIPTSASASAGASLMPSPTMATTSPFALQRAHVARLVLGHQLGHHAIDAQARGDGLGDAARVARHQEHLAPSARAQRVDDGRALGARLVGVGDRRLEAVVDGDEEGRGAERPVARGDRLDLGRCRGRESASAGAVRRGRDGRRPAPRRPRRSCSARTRARRRASPRPRAPRRCASPSRSGACGATRPPRRTPRTSWRDRAPSVSTSSTSGSPRVSVPVLSKTTVSARDEPLEVLPALDEHPAVGGDGERRQRGRRNGDADAAAEVGDEDARQPIEVAGQAPRREPQREGRQDEPVGDRLRRALQRHRLVAGRLEHADDPRRGRVGAGALHLDDDLPVDDDRGRVHASRRLFRERGSDSPVSGFSSTVAAPSTTTPSAPMRSPGYTTMRSPGSELRGPRPSRPRPTARAARRGWPRGARAPTSCGARGRRSARG